MSYLAIAAHCVECARAQGFADTTLDTANDRLCGMHSEALELLDAIAAGDERAMARESADVAIFALTVMHNLGAANWTPRGRIHIVPPLHAAPETLVAPLQKHIDRAYRAWRRSDARDVCVALELLVAQLVDLRTRCLRLPHDLRHDIHAKLALNAGRPKLNGHTNPRS